MGAGSPCPLGLHLSKYPGNAELAQALKNGMTPVFSFWSSDKMLWMDGKGPDGQGPCWADSSKPCMKKKPSVSNFEIKSEGKPCDERCPVGRCEKYPDGEEEGYCRWFFGRATEEYVPSAYHCKVDSCDQVPKGHDITPCWETQGEHFYSITDRNAQCQSEKAAEEEKEEVDELKDEKE